MSQKLKEAKSSFFNYFSKKSTKKSKETISKKLSKK